MNAVSQKKYFPWLIIIIGAGFLLLTLGSIFIAQQKTSAVTDQNYYSHGLRYNKTLLEKKAAETLGWTIEINLFDQDLQIELRDRQNMPVMTAKGSIVLYANDHKLRDSQPIIEIGNGQYVVSFPKDLSGPLNARIEFERDGARLTRQLLLNFRDDDRQ